MASLSLYPDEATEALNMIDETLGDASMSTMYGFLNGCLASSVSLWSLWMTSGAGGNS